LIGLNIEKVTSVNSPKEFQADKFDSLLNVIAPYFKFDWVKIRYQIGSMPPAKHHRY
jgi:hypothetical protein